MAETENNEFEIDIPEQGVALTVDRKGVLKFLDQETGFYNQIRSLFSGGLILWNQNFGEIRLHENAISGIGQVRAEFEGGNRKPFEDYIQSARELRIVIGAG